VWADLSTMAAGCVPVPMHALDNPASIAYILGDCEAAVLIARSGRHSRSRSASTRRSQPA